MSKRRGTPTGNTAHHISTFHPKGAVFMGDPPTCVSYVGFIKSRARHEGSCSSDVIRKRSQEKTVRNGGKKDRRVKEEKPNYSCSGILRASDPMD